MTVSSDDIIAVEKLVKKFGNFTAVDHISFSVKKGEIFGFLGANGSGKSTTIRMLCGILTPTSGSGHVAGYDIFTNPELIKQSIGYMSQRFSLYDELTPYENLRFYLGIYRIPTRNWNARIEWVLEMTRLSSVRNRLTKELPQGWKQRLSLGSALLHKPDILFLDEPTSGVDPVTRRHFWDFIGDLAKKGMTAFVTTHYMDEAQNCNRIVMISRGNIVASGSPDTIINEACPDRPDANLNDAFITIMSRRN